MQTDDLTLRVLIEIRDGISQTNQRLDQTNQRLDQTRTELGARIDVTNQRLDQTNLRIDETNQRLVETEVRLATAINGMAGTLGDVHRLLKERLDLGERVTRCEHDIDELKRRVS